MISLFGIDPLREDTVHGKKNLPFHKLAESVRDDIRLEGLTEEGIHRFYGAFVESVFFRDASCETDKERILFYEENIARHTRRINEHRDRPVTWKYFQWLALLFAEIYLDRFFSDKKKLLSDLNAYVRRFNERYPDYGNIDEYGEEDLNKICFQNATGSGKTLLMHVNLLQYLDYAERSGPGNQTSRTILITPNDVLGGQHEAEFAENGFSTGNYARDGEALFCRRFGREHVDILEITKLADRKGPATIATDGLGRRNLLLVDEGHRGAGTDEGVWLARRSKLCEKGFAMEYSATFSQAVSGTKSEDSYAKSILFDYSYRWFYEDGFGKEYDIFNLPKGAGKTDGSRTEDPGLSANYLTACLLKYYQQLRIYGESPFELRKFNVEKPLWVFVGSSVVRPSTVTDKKIEKRYVSDVANILRFFAVFVHDESESVRRINHILYDRGKMTGLLDENDMDIFEGAFLPLRRLSIAAKEIYSDILDRLFQCKSGGTLALDRTKGDSGEILLRLGNSGMPFGLVTVGDTRGLYRHLDEMRRAESIPLILEESQFADAVFNTIKDSRSPINLLIGAKKFIEGWDCWRVGTMGLMHVGRTEGAQVIQLFGRGIRLKGYDWSLKRSSRIESVEPPRHIAELETLNVFGIGSAFMEKFRDYLKSEGLPDDPKSGERQISLNGANNTAERLKTLRSKWDDANERENLFEKEAPVTVLDGTVPGHLVRHPIVSDWFPRIQVISTHASLSVSKKEEVKLNEEHVALLDLDALYFELERLKRSRSWHHLAIAKEGLRRLLLAPNWYVLYLPEERLRPKTFADVRILQRVASELLMRYCDQYYNYKKQELIETRSEP